MEDQQKDIIKLSNIKRNLKRLKTKVAFNLIVIESVHSRVFFFFIFGLLVVRSSQAEDGRDAAAQHVMD